MSESKTTGIFLADRGLAFKTLITKLVSLGGVKPKYVELLTDTYAMSVYDSSFTSDDVNHKHNYQVHEQLGDVVLNQIIVEYMHAKFPILDCPEGVAIVARLRILYGSKECFSEIARKLGFWNFISATNEVRQRKMKPLLEDVFEAFIGATIRIINKRKRVGVGYAIVYDIVASILDSMTISLSYEDLYDAKTRLKELFDKIEVSSSMGTLSYKEEKLPNQLTRATIYRKIGTQTHKIAEGTASLKADAQQNAAQNALNILAKQNILKEIPTIFTQLAQQQSIENTPDTTTLKPKWLADINSLQHTKKSKYQNKYQSTPLSFFCMKRNLQRIEECINLGADINIPDTDEMCPLDLLFIGKTDIPLLKNIITSILSKQTDTPLKIHSDIFNMYYSTYKTEDPYFETIIDKLNILH